jgi:hypothetical protein
MLPSQQITRGILLNLAIPERGQEQTLVTLKVFCRRMSSLLQWSEEKNSTFGHLQSS